MKDSVAEQRTKAATLTSGKLIYYLSTSACLFKEVRWPPLVHLCEAKHHTEFSSVAAISQMGKLLLQDVQGHCT